MTTLSENIDKVRKWGVSIAVLLLLISIVGAVYVPEISFSSEVNPLILILSLSHMAMSWAFTRRLLNRQLEDPPPIDLKDHRSHKELGSLLAMTGYLHTLIGVSAAIVALAEMLKSDLTPEPGSLVFVALGIGSSLITSIIGWWGGKEFQCQRYSSITFREEHAAEIRAISIIEGLQETLEKSFEIPSANLRDAINDSAKSIRATTQSAHGSIVGTFSQIEEWANEAQKTSVAATASVEELGQSYSSLLRRLSVEIDDTLKECLDLAQNTKNTSDNLGDIQQDMAEVAEVAARLRLNLSQLAETFSEPDDLVHRLLSESRLNGGG